MGELEQINKRVVVASEATLVEVVVAPVVVASSMIARCRQAGAANLIDQWRSRGGVGRVLNLRSENIPRAVALRAALPPEHLVRAAYDSVAAALAEPADSGFTEMLVASLLDGLVRKQNAEAGAGALLGAFSEVVGDDEAAEMFDLYPVLAAPPVVIVYACRRLRRLQTFQPTPAEFATACRVVSDKLHSGRDELWAWVLLSDDVGTLAPAPEGDRSGDDDDVIPF